MSWQEASQNHKLSFDVILVATFDVISLVLNYYFLFDVNGSGAI